MNDKYYLTTTLPYVNADPHIGFALEIVQADVLARYHRTLGKEVFFNTGTDEHGLKIYRQALESGKDPQSFADECAKKFDNLKKALNLSYQNFIRTTDPAHLEAAQTFWKQCLKNGDIYKGKQEIKYCVGCELEKTESELPDGRCPTHPNLKIELLEEENYFFRFSKYQKALLKLYQDKPDFVVPDFRLKEIRTFVKQGLKDFSISRLKSKLPWGVNVPGDPNHVMYVWFDALINYISAVGWPKDLAKFNDWWPGIQVAGKDNLRQQSAMWQAMLLSAGLPPSKQIFIHGFVSAEGQKMSKSLGNVVDPFRVVKKYGTDAVRYYLLREIPAYGDGDFSEYRFAELYNADLANGLGNLVARVLALVEKFSDGKVPEIDKDPDSHPLRVDEKIHNWKKSWRDLDLFLPKFKFDEALISVWKFIGEADKYIDRNKPWDLEKNDRKRFNWVVYGLLDSIHQLAWQLYPFIPETAVSIARQLSAEKLLTGNPLNKDSWVNLRPGTKVKIDRSLFPRLEKPLSFPQSARGQIVIGKITDLQPHPHARKLRIVEVDIGLGNPLTIICGAQNLKIGQIVPVAQPGATVNQPLGKTLKVKKTNIRGVKSEAMLCSELELKIGKNHREICLLPDALASKIGQPFRTENLG